MAVFNTLLSSNQVMAAVRAIGWRGTSAGLSSADYLAEEFLPRGLRMVLGCAALREFVAKRFGERLPGGFGYITAKSNAIDDLVRRSIADQAHTQVVMVGAGFDSRPYRLDALRRNVAVYEVDDRNAVLAKQKTLRRLGLKHAHVTWLSTPVGADSRGLTPDWFNRRGIHTDERTLFVLDGLTYFLPPPVLARLFESIGEFAVGSEVVFDFAYAEILSGKSYLGSAEFCASLARIGEPVRVGIPEHDLVRFLHRVGLAPVTRLSPYALAQQYLTDTHGNVTAPYGFLELVRARVGQTSAQAVL